jgi:hypothetical protein
LSWQPTWNNLAPTRWNVMKFFIRDFMQICWHIPSVVKIRQNNRHLTWRPVYLYDYILPFMKWVQEVWQSQRCWRTADDENIIHYVA